jgi:tetratricopeptide (TPR) repeat protein
LISAAGEKMMIVLPGWGRHHYGISTKSDSAQFYFNQGLSMYYSYHWREANASFKEAARFDPKCAMAIWGQALARGPGYNFAHSYVMPKDIPGLIEKMNSLLAGTSDKERDLITAMNARYSNDSTDKGRKILNASYSRRMRELIDKYPDDADITALYVDAVMLEHPWNFWNNDGAPKSWTPELVELCEKIFTIDRKHPGALHYYIHVTEASRNPTRALHSADVLKDLLPGVAHMVHMSSHVYERNGSYEEGVAVNEKADQDLVHYDSLVRSLKTISLSPHVSHYFAVQTYCALSGGMYSKGMPLAVRVRESVSPTRENTYQQYLYMMPSMAMVRLGKWKEIIDGSKEPDPSWPYASLLHDFAKGMAYVNTNNLPAAKTHLQQLSRKSKDSILTEINIPFNAPSQGAYIAENILRASILFSEKQYDTAIDCLHKAIRMEDSLVYIEPKDWLIPARQYLGAYLLQLKKFHEAEKTYREDLVWNPGNGWSLLGLSQSLKAQGRPKEAAIHQPGYMKSFSAADEIPPGSVYLK